MIVCAGESLIDFVPGDGPGPLPSYRPVPGGCPFNVAISAARLGAEVRFLGGVSTDFFGEAIISRLRDNGVSDQMVHRISNPTTLAFVARAADGSAEYAFYTRDAADRQLPRPIAPEGLPTGAILQIGSISLIPDQSGNALVELAERLGDVHLVAFDPNIRANLVAVEGVESSYRDRVDRALRAATVVKISDEDLAWVRPGLAMDAAARDLLSPRTRLVVVTAGSRGSTAYRAESARTHAAPFLHVDAPPTDVVDTIGAGDSFLGALLFRLEQVGRPSAESIDALTEAEISDALQFCARVASITCSRAGADPPTLAQAEAS